MTNPQVYGRVSFGGIRGVMAFSYTRSRGIQPGLIQIKIPDLSVDIPLRQTALLLSDLQNNLTFPNCKVVDPDFLSQEGQEFVINIQDFRWQWKFGGLFGNYNTIRAGEIIVATRKSIRELAELCFEQLSHTGTPNLSNLPSDVYPETKWDNTNPAVALQELCDLSGCVICPTLTGGVAIQKLGVGAELPQMQGAQIDSSVDMAELPRMVEIHAAPTLVEMSIEIGEPVGIEADGRVVPIDQLSYTPPNGWGSEDPQDFMNVEKESRKYAEMSVWKWYRIIAPSVIDGFDFTPELDQMLPIEDSLVEKETVLGQVRRKSMFAYGVYYNRREKDANNVEAFSHDYVGNPELKYKGSVQVDNDRGLVQFGEPTFRLNANTGDNRYVMLAPVMYLRCAFSISDNETFARWRYVLKSPNIGQDPTPPLKIQRESVRNEMVIDAQSGNITSDNESQVDSELQYYMQAELAKMQNLQPSKGTYSGFQPIELDGAIAQVSYAIEGSGYTTTVASRNTEHSETTPSLEVRNRNAKLLQTLKDMESITKAGREVNQGKR
jgi:hypothetical protein